MRPKRPLGLENRPGKTNISRLEKSVLLHLLNPLCSEEEKAQGFTDANRRRFLCVKLQKPEFVKTKFRDAAAREEKQREGIFEAWTDDAMKAFYRSPLTHAVVSRRDIAFLRQLASAHPGENLDTLVAGMLSDPSRIDAAHGSSLCKDSDWFAREVTSGGGGEGVDAGAHSYAPAADGRSSVRSTRA